MSGRVLSLTASLRHAVEQPVLGEGGFQTLFRELQAQIEEDVLRITDEQISRARRYADDYGAGGFQQRLREILTAVDRPEG